MGPLRFRFGKRRADRGLRRIVRPLWGRDTPSSRAAILRRLCAEGAVDVTELLTAHAASEPIHSSGATPPKETHE